jgi:hypothetical protein
LPGDTCQTLYEQIAKVRDIRWKNAIFKLDETAFKNALLRGIFDDAPGTVEEIAQATIARDL